MVLKTGPTKICSERDRMEFNIEEKNKQTNKQTNNNVLHLGEIIN